ncbi:propionyl-CoA carboxylase [Sneathiella chungangensis]|uniref:Propionyl-CoA carboxylase n=1 Tax=Sneathiella chungangensis TaxID=1418234 RepID=A0A845MCZ2_9PROT|nr:carboxyl transferase domain-containing protein [Sneathiella chungangensis]MZR21848.1 propionyl-CoA carboxylase [Sneathiella chungangensis]
MSWEKEAEEIKKMRVAAQAQGGKEAIEIQHAKGRLTIRERIDSLLDTGSFQEQGRIAGAAERDENGNLKNFSPANYITGLGLIDGRRVAVGGEDFTLKGGSPNAAGLRKSVFAEELASQYRVPLVRMLEGGGGSVAKGKGGGTVGSPAYEKPRFLSIAKLMGEVPVASAALGPVAGFPAARFAASHFSVMTRETAQLLIAGPALVERALNIKISKEDLGGASVHSRNAVAANIAKDEADALAQIRKFLSYLPANVWELPARLSSDDPTDRMDEDLLSIVPKNRRLPFKMRNLVQMVVDRDSFFEMGKNYGPSLITAFARLDGQSVGVIANDCRYYAGAMGANAAQKVRRFIELCDTFHLPIVNFTDEPGFMIGPDAEKDGTIKYGTSAVAAAAMSVVPWATIIVKKAFGVAAAAHFSENGYVLAWPSAEMGPLPVEGGVAVAFRRQIEASDNPEQLRAELEEQLAAQQSPFPRAESFSIHDIIDPRETRPALCQWIDWIGPQLESLKGPVSFYFRP